MSTDYGLFCQDCKKSKFYGGPFDTHWDLILEIWKGRDQLARVYTLIKELDAMPIHCIEVSVSLDYGNSSPVGIFEFLEKHEGHNIVIRDEYGYLWDQDWNKIGELEEDLRYGES